MFCFFFAVSGWRFPTPINSEGFRFKRVQKNGDESDPETETAFGAHTRSVECFLNERTERKKIKHPVRRILHAIGLATLWSVLKAVLTPLFPVDQAAVFQPLISSHLVELHLFSLSEARRRNPPWQMSPIEPRRRIKTKQSHTSVIILRRVEACERERNVFG